MPLGISVQTSETAQSGGVSTALGTVFIVGSANYGPEVPTVIRSLNEYISLYGPRETESAFLYDAVNSFFQLEGSRAYISRTAGEGSPAAAKLELESAATAKTLVVTAKYKGTFGNSIKVTVETVSTESRLIIEYNGEIVESSPLQAKCSELFEWGKTHTAYVTITEGSGYSTGKTEKLKAVAATKLASGVNPTNSKPAVLKSLEAISKNLGPGQLIIPGNFEEGVHTAMAEHASKNNRFAMADLKEASVTGTTAATLVGEKGTYSNSIASYISFFSTAITAGGTAGTTRTVPVSSVIAGLFAKVSRTENNNQAPAGIKWPLAPYVTGLINNYVQSSEESLDNAGINNLTERFGVLCLYGDKTAISQEVDPIFYQYSAVRERMQLVAESEEIAERFVFATLDGRHQKRSKFAGELQALIKNHWEKGALYGETPQEAGIVNVESPINTLATESAGELKAELQVRISPVAQFVSIQITSKSITESV